MRIDFSAQKYNNFVIQEVQTLLHYFRAVILSASSEKI